MIRKFFKDAGFVSGSEVLLKLKGLIIIPLLTYHFGAVNYGVWSQVLILIAIIAPFVMLSTDSGFMRHVAGHTLDLQKGYFSAWLVFILVNATLICSLLVLLRGNTAGLFFGESDEYGRFIVLAAISMFLTVILSAARQWFLLQNRPRLYGVISILEGAFGVLAVIATLVLNQGVFELVIYILAGLLAINLIVYTFIGRVYGFREPDFSIIVPLLKFGLPLLPAGFAVWGLNYMDRLFLLEYGTMADVGIYSFVYSVGYMVITLLARPFRMMYPPLATGLYNRGQTAEHQRLFNYSAASVLGLTFPAMVGLFVLRDPIVGILAPPEFALGAPLISLVTFGYIFMVMASYYEVHLGLVFRQHWFTISVTVAFGVNFLLNFLLIPKYLILGAAIATTISFMTQFVVSFLVARQRAVVKSDLIFAAKVIIASIGMGQAVFTVGSLLFQGSHNLYLELVLMTVVGVMVYGALMYVIGAIPRDNVAILFGELGLRRS